MITNMNYFDFNFTDGYSYRLKRITPAEEQSLPLLNFLGHGPLNLISQCQNDWSDDNRLEKLFFVLQRNEEGLYKDMGYFEFTYLAWLKSYEAGYLYGILDTISSFLGEVGLFISNNYRRLRNEKAITPNVLTFEAAYNLENPHLAFPPLVIDNAAFTKIVLKAAARLVSNYVNVPIQNLTILEINDQCEDYLPYSEPLYSDSDYIDTIVNYGCYSYI